MPNEAQAQHPQEIPRLIQKAVADCHNIDIEEISQPMGRVIDIESLTSLWWPSNRFHSDPDGVLKFDYYGCRVTVSSDGLVKATKHTDL